MVFLRPHQDAIYGTKFTLHELATMLHSGNLLANFSALEQP